MKRKTCDWYGAKYLFMYRRKTPKKSEHLTKIYKTDLITSLIFIKWNGPGQITCFMVCSFIYVLPIYLLIKIIKVKIFQIYINPSLFHSAKPSEEHRQLSYVIIWVSLVIWTIVCCFYFICNSFNFDDLWWFEILYNTCRLLSNLFVVP